MPGETITTIRNKHAESCGQPPTLDHDDIDYMSYFENDYGEQLFFVFDGEEAKVYHGDVGWEDPQIIPKRELDGFTLDDFLTISRNILDDQEGQWLMACIDSLQYRL